MYIVSIVEICVQWYHSAATTARIRSAELPSITFQGLVRHRVFFFFILALCDNNKNEEDGRTPTNQIHTSCMLFQLITL
jgi:hypothetical protein